MAAACFRAGPAGEPSPDRGTERPGVLVGYRRTAADSWPRPSAAVRGADRGAVLGRLPAAAPSRESEDVALERGRFGRGDRRSPVR